MGGGGGWGIKWGWRLWRRWVCLLELFVFEIGYGEYVLVDEDVEFGVVELCG